MVKQVVTFSAFAVLTLTGLAVQASPMTGHVVPEKATGTAVGSKHADVVKHKTCHNCAMDRNEFAHSRVLITYSDGSTVGVCSINCLANELKANKGKKVNKVAVADLNSKKLVDVKKTTWVIGGNKKGVMTLTPKWAFAKKDDAVAFISKNGGRLATYNEALALAENE